MGVTTLITSSGMILQVGQLGNGIKVITLLFLGICEKQLDLVTFKQVSTTIISDQSILRRNMGKQV